MAGKRAGAAVVAMVLLAGCGGKSPPATMEFQSRPDLMPPVVTVLARTGGVSPGYVFIAPKKDAPQRGPEIVDADGQPVWFDPVPDQVTDFRVQTYRGKPVLTWWEGPAASPILGTGYGHFVIMDNSYRQVAQVEAGFGRDSGDLHEFKLTPRGTALLASYKTVAGSLRALGGPRNARIADSVVQEVDVQSGRVLFTWHSIDHVPVTESYIPLSGPGAPPEGNPYDYFHVNSIEEEPDGNLLISARNTCAVYELDRKTGAILWRLGGKKSSFEMGRGTTFAWQHDARRMPDGTITLFDNGAAPPREKHSRALRLRLDMKGKTASLVRADVSPAGVLASSQGDAQTLENGHVFVGWGAVPRFTEFSADGSVVYDATFSDGDDSYRAYRFRWSAAPTTRPSIEVDAGGGDKATIYASWNGATEVAAWRVVAGDAADRLAPVGRAQAKAGFETKLEAGSKAPYLAVEALDAGGNVLGRSAAVQRGGLAIG